MSESSVGSQGRSLRGSPTRTRLPHPNLEGNVTVEVALRERRSVREFRKGEPLTLGEVSQLLWASQGITRTDGGRTSPSAGALYPLEVSVAVGEVRDLSPGVYRYDPAGHDLQLFTVGDVRMQLSEGAIDQSVIKEALLVIVVSAVYERTTTKYGARGVRYVHFEVGHAAQNVSLQAVSLGLGATVIGAFSDEEVKRVLGLPGSEEVLYLIPVGRK